jgi:hypothetical protein
MNCLDISFVFANHFHVVPEEPSPSKLASFSNINFLSLVGIITALEWWIGHERKGDPNVHNVFKGIWDHMSFQAPAVNPEKESWR